MGGQEPGGGVGQDQRPGTFGPGSGEGQGHRAGVELGDERGLLGADRVQDRGQVLGVGLPRGQRVSRLRIGGAGAPPVEHDQPGERGQRTQEQGDPGSSRTMSTWL